jgi:hypothetical protein
MAPDSISWKSLNLLLNSGRSHPHPARKNLPPPQIVQVIGGTLADEDGVEPKSY